jgi:hypothetical protein
VTFCGVQEVGRLGRKGQDREVQAAPPVGTELLWDGD